MLPTMPMGGGGKNNKTEKRKRFKGSTQEAKIGEPSKTAPYEPFHGNQGDTVGMHGGNL